MSQSNEIPPELIQARKMLETMRDHDVPENYQFWQSLINLLDQSIDEAEEERAALQERLEFLQNLQKLRAKQRKKPDAWGDLSWLDSDDEDSEEDEDRSDKNN